jgi:hypothetical protein
MKLSKCINFGGLSVLVAAAVVLSMVIAGSAQAGQLSDFNDGTAQGWVPDTAGVTLTPDCTTSSEGACSLLVDVANGGFNFGVMRYDHGAVNPHSPQWLPPNITLLFDVKERTFTDFMTVRPSFNPSGPTGSGGTTNGPDFTAHTPAGWKTLSWTYPPNGSASGPPNNPPPFWIEWFSSNSNGPMSFWIDNIRTVGPVPEPASFALMGLGAIGLSVLRRKRR